MNKIKRARLLSVQNNSIHDGLIAQAGTDSSHKWISIDQAERLIDLTVQEAVDELLLHGYDDAAGCLSRHFEVIS
jgi:hypothetical protein